MTSSAAFEFPEPLIAAILGQAIKEGRAAELWEVLTAGGSATIDTQTGRLVTVSAEVLHQMWNRPPKRKSHKNKNLSGCQSRLYWGHCVAAKCGLGVGHAGGHHSGTRTWNDADASYSASRAGREPVPPLVGGQEVPDGEGEGL